MNKTRKSIWKRYEAWISGIVIGALFCLIGQCQKENIAQYILPIIDSDGREVHVIRVSVDLGNSKLKSEEISKALQDEFGDTAALSVEQLRVRVQSEIVPRLRRRGVVVKGVELQGELGEWYPVELGSERQRLAQKSSTYSKEAREMREVVVRIDSHLNKGLEKLEISTLEGRLVGSISGELLENKDSFVETRVIAAISKTGMIPRPSLHLRFEYSSGKEGEVYLYFGEIGGVFDYAIFPADFRHRGEDCTEVTNTFDINSSSSVFEHLLSGEPWNEPYTLEAEEGVMPKIRGFKDHSTGGFYVSAYLFWAE